MYILVSHLPYDFCVNIKASVMQVFLFTEEVLCSALATLTYLNSGSGFCY